MKQNKSKRGSPIIKGIISKLADANWTLDEVPAAYDSEEKGEIKY